MSGWYDIINIIDQGILFAFVTVIKVTVMGATTDDERYSYSSFVKMLKSQVSISCWVLSVSPLPPTPPTLRRW